MSGIPDISGKHCKCQNSSERCDMNVDFPLQALINHSQSLDPDADETGIIPTLTASWQWLENQIVVRNLQIVARCHQWWADRGDRARIQIRLYCIALHSMHWGNSGYDRPECDEYIRIFEYSNIFDPNIYSDIRSYHFLDTNIFGYSFVSTFWIRIYSDIRS